LAACGYGCAVGLAAAAALMLFAHGASAPAA
jgi:hypothetical protein